MRPPEIEDEQIIEAGKQLQADSRRVTGFALRKTVGEATPADWSGSGKITNALRKWWTPSQSRNFQWKWKKPLMR